MFGILNAVVGIWATWLLRPLVGPRDGAAGARACWCFLLVGRRACSRPIFSPTLAEEDLFPDPVVYARNSPYQRIVVTSGRSGFQLFLNGHLQFSSADEYRYHEALVHPAMALAGNPRRVLVLGGGDGLALREILKIPSVESVTLVDLDPEMTKLSDAFQAAGRIERPFASTTRASRSSTKTR